MTEFEQLEQEILRGITGENAIIPMGLDRMSRHIGVRKRIMSLVFGATGSGKSALVHNLWILNTFEYIRNTETKIKVKPILFSFERSKIYTKAKWLSRKIFLDAGVLIPIPKMLGWWDTKISHDEHDLIKGYSDWVNELFEFVIFREGNDNPTGLYKYIKSYAESHGKIHEINEFDKVYEPNDPNEVVVPIIDHMGLTKRERNMDKKEAIEKLSEYAQGWRELYGYSPVFVAQINRDLGSVHWQKTGDFEPSIDHIKETGSPGEAADIVISLFDPLRYKTTDAGGYDVQKFVNPANGANNFRSMKVLKNTYGEDHIRCGMAFHGSTGTFLELPKRVDVTDKTYEDVISGKYFLKH